MQKVVEIKDLNFNYSEKPVFKHLNLSIEKGKITMILGANGTGKTTLVKLLLGLEQGNSVIILDRLPVIKENLPRIYKAIGVVFENQDQNFVTSTVTDELAFTLENLNYSKSQIQKNIAHIAKIFDLQNLLNEPLTNLNAGEKQLVALASALITKPPVLIIDEGLSSLDLPLKNKILNTLKDLNQKEKITIIYLTCNSENTLIADNLIILNNHHVEIATSRKEVYKNERNFLNAHLEPPFIIKLSKRLQFYNLIQEDYQSKEKLVNALWK